MTETDPGISNRMWQIKKNKDVGLNLPIKPMISVIKVMNRWFLSSTIGNLEIGENRKARQLRRFK